MQTAKERSNSQGTEKEVLSWLDYDSLVNQLAEKIKASNIDFGFVHGVPRGGVIPAVMLSHILNIEYYSCIRYLHRHCFVAK